VRLHVIGIGHAPNTWLVRKMAQAGRGLAELIGDPTDAGTRMLRFLDRIERPVISDVRLRWNGVPPEEVFSSGTADLYGGEPLVLWSRLGAAAIPSALTIEGWTRTGAVQDVVELEAVEGEGVARRWARAKIESLEDTLHEGADPDAVRREIVDLAVDFGIVTTHTSLVAVEERPSTLGVPRPVRVAAVLPRGGTDGPRDLSIGGGLAAAGLVLLAVGRIFRR
jgi:Ca-activated chloride channel family protein